MAIGYGVVSLLELGNETATTTITDIEASIFLTMLLIWAVCEADMRIYVSSKNYFYTEVILTTQESRKRTADSDTLQLSAIIGVPSTASALSV
jgi:hypothetical protein